MIRRFLGWLRRIQNRPQSTLTRVRTDMTDCVYLHAGDSLDIVKVVEGFSVFAYVVRGGAFHEWPLYNCASLREAENLRVALDAALVRKAKRFDARAELQRQREAALVAHQEVAI
jgi:aryl-alcohol dehydrogenase-like predicted oxidoreductase